MSTVRMTRSSTFSLRYAAMPSGGATSHSLDVFGAFAMPPSLEFLAGGISNRVGRWPLVVFYAPKLLLVLLIWILLSVSYVLFAARRETDPTFQVYGRSVG